jgi:hypothetical protein
MKNPLIRAFAVVAGVTAVSWLLGMLIAKGIALHLAAPHATAYFGGVVIQ